MIVCVRVCVPGAGQARVADDVQQVKPHQPTKAGDAGEYKRLSRNEVEQKRRQQARQHYEELRALIPNSANFDKNTLLQHAIQAIRDRAGVSEQELARMMAEMPASADNEGDGMGDFGDTLPTLPTVTTLITNKLLCSESSESSNNFQGGDSGGEASPASKDAAQVLLSVRRALERDAASTPPTACRSLVSMGTGNSQPHTDLDTVMDRKLSKKKKRMLKNCLSAPRSRERKNVTMQSVQDEIAVLCARNEVMFGLSIALFQSHTR